ncbi:oxidoreductase [Kutzneria albida DSM 43870]|uniref:Oxidoreductase n=2 Tax=Kutzneria TaxID=43356 RepID=W5WCF4_9PSEU|nr:oxidoreductase [Kutzneria albida DSM 43870]
MRTMVVSSPEELAVVDAPEPVPAAGQVRIEVDAVGVGYLDVMAQRGQYRTTLGAGAVPGAEVVGRVAAVGPGTPTGLVGNRVLAVMPDFGGFAEQVLAEADAVFPAPDELDAAEVVGLGLNAIVAELGLHRAGVRAGDRVLVLGAGGGIGVLATQIARAHGAEVTVMTSSEARGERLRALGATHVVDRNRTGSPEGETYDLVVDPIAGPALGKHLRLLRPNGRYVLCGGAAGIPDPQALLSLLEDFHKSPTLFAFSLTAVSARERRQSWERIMGLLAEGRLVSVVDQSLPLAEAGAALERVAEGKPFGKVVLHPR